VNVSDPYKVLQVDPEAEDEVIEAAYRRLARKYHPDVAEGPDAQERMVNINRAWEMLRDPLKRAAVDRARTRTAGAAATVAAADARARTTSTSRPAPSSSPHRAPAGHDGPAGTTASRAAWGFPGVSDPGDAGLGPRPQFVSPNWTSGRSAAGHRYDAGTMGTTQGDGAAGPPPGNPRGSVLNFGRYAGWSLGEIARMDLEYLEWLDRTPIGRTYQGEIDELLRAYRRRMTASNPADGQRGLFRRR
jgi:curved DNA-binding protein CbpA